jgi:hypothetical protein
MTKPGIKFDKGGKVHRDKLKENERIVKAVWEILKNDQLDDLTKYDLVSVNVRKWTSIHTVNGNYRGVPYFTPAAYKDYKELWDGYKPNLTGFSKILGSYFTHEQILPVNAAVALFNVNNHVTEEYVRYVLYSEVNAAVVTKEEAKLLDIPKYKDKMPATFYLTRNIFDRYSAVGLNLLYVVWDEEMKNIVGQPQPVNMSIGVLANHFYHHFESVVDDWLKEFKKSFPVDDFEFPRDKMEALTKALADKYVEDFAGSPIKQLKRSNKNKE